ncbi:MAG: OmpH family outer membrane protein [Candidatus Cloacimonadales bacterium]
MKKIILLVLLTLCLGIGIANATNLAYVNVERIMVEANDVQEAKRIFDSESQAWRTEIEAMQQELELMSTQYENKKLILNEQTKKEAANKIKAKEEEVNRKMQQYFGQQGTAATRNAELLEPILDRVNEVIQAIAIDENFDMVLDITAGNVLYAKEHMDITEKVISRLNKGKTKDTDSSSTPDKGKK